MLIEPYQEVQSEQGLNPIPLFNCSTEEKAHPGIAHSCSLTLQVPDG